MPVTPDPSTGIHAVPDDLLGRPGVRTGKVRVAWPLRDDRMLFLTTDRLSAFDRVLAVLPGKGQVLNELSAWWFARTADVLPNHLLSVPHPNLTVARACTPLPVEVIVRGVITGVTSTSLWTRYAAGARVIDGHVLPDGLTKNALLPTPIITPTTKAEAGAHDEPLSVHDVAARGLVDAALWERICTAALALFARGQAEAAAHGLVLADTKYELGIDADGALRVIDELHTPDSSRFWVAAGHAERVAAGEEPEQLDKELVRRAFAAHGWRGDGPRPELGAEVWERVRDVYTDVYARFVGHAPVPSATDPFAIVRSILDAEGTTD